MSDCNQQSTSQQKKPLQPLFLRSLKKLLKIGKIILTCLVIIFSPFIVWVILSLNRELIVIMANWDWLSSTFPLLFHALGEQVNTSAFARGFNEAALGGLLTLFGVVVTVWYYQMVRVQEVTEKRLFVIDELLEELKKNRAIVAALNEEKVDQPCTMDNDKFPPGERVFVTEAWHKLGADVALLPRRLHLRLSILYGCLNRCRNKDDYHKNKASIDRINGIIAELHKFRSSLSKSDIA
ncbi:hypothetical protein SAMN05660649_01460 [Desulfotomaculum arcticum]|uniref:Uncharacterized protein n=1 Tax=Desulfotruncus arcticus DSM 17038 TaxID=1121424 RepID=A0A1I2R9T7_9FIRM|nr:hypothetical protein [Desulfotruncus arcticus]SFG37222.1 hypothetical protein SAMN05660649_01460 [Desulfotomaculum arcticum] [Desulfotruncus arcticus DSM 17038]